MRFSFFMRSILIGRRIYRDRRKECFLRTVSGTSLFTAARMRAFYRYIAAKYLCFWVYFLDKGLKSYLGTEKWNSLSFLLKTTQKCIGWLCKQTYILYARLKLGINSHSNFLFHPLLLVSFEVSGLAKYSKQTPFLHLFPFFDKGWCLPYRYVILHKGSRYWRLWGLKNRSTFSKVYFGTRLE